MGAVVNMNENVLNAPQEIKVLAVGAPKCIYVHIHIYIILV